MYLNKKTLNSKLLFLLLLNYNYNQVLGEEEATTTVDVCIINGESKFADECYDETYKKYLDNYIKSKNIQNEGIIKWINVKYEYIKDIISNNNKNYEIELGMSGIATIGILYFIKDKKTLKIFSIIGGLLTTLTVLNSYLSITGIQLPIIPGVFICLASLSKLFYINNKEHIMKKLGFKENQDQINKIENETINIEDKSKENDIIVKTEESQSKELDNIKLNKEEKNFKETKNKTIEFKENQDQTNKIENETINIEYKSKENDVIVKKEESESKKIVKKESFFDVVLFLSFIMSIFN